MTTEPKQLSGIGLANHYKRLTTAIVAGIDAAKGVRREPAALFLAALHEAGFDVVEVPAEAENAMQFRDVAAE